MKLSVFRKIIPVQAKYIGSLIGTLNCPGLIIYTDQVQKVWEVVYPLFGDKHVLVLKKTKETLYDAYRFEMEDKFNFDADYLTSHCFVFTVLRREPKHEA